MAIMDDVTGGSYSLRKVIIRMLWTEQRPLALFGRNGSPFFDRDGKARYGSMVCALQWKETPITHADLSIPSHPLVSRRMHCG